MNDYEARIAPFINVRFWVTSIFGAIRGTDVHRGIDIATASALGPVPLYSMVDGQIIVNTTGSSYGNYIIIKETSTGMGFLYAHMLNRSPLPVGTLVRQGQEVGMEGSSGESTGLHLHLEMQDISTHNWIYRAPITQYENPADYMGFPNTEGISVYYDGTPIPPEPISPKIKNFPWVLYARKLRKK